MQGLTKDLENRLGVSLSAEARERDLREAAEAGRDRAVKVIYMYRTFCTITVAIYHIR